MAILPYIKSNMAVSGYSWEHCSNMAISLHIRSYMAIWQYQFILDHAYIAKSGQINLYMAISGYKKLYMALLGYIKLHLAK